MGKDVADKPDMTPETAGPLEETGPPEEAAPDGHTTFQMNAAPDGPGPTGPGPTGPAPTGPAPRRSFWRRRSWKRWLADAMIIAGVLLLAYPVGTWGYTWYEQRELRQQLQSDNPQLAASSAALNATDFIPVEVKGEHALQSTTTTTIDPDVAAAQAAAAAAAAAEGERLAVLAAFKAAADDFERSVAGQTGEPIGQILIPSIGLDVIMVEGTGKGDLREGPGHWPETPFPGQGGNFVVSGHRTTYGAPFLRLNKVKVGDEIDLVLPYAVARYTVTRVIIVYPDEVDEVAQLGREQVSLAACHPLYSAKQRIVVQGDLVGFKLMETQD
jgi:LPXTG-site transpeptidase (sortase) family protein